VTIYKTEKGNNTDTRILMGGQRRMEEASL
jgi:hypothetical protein